MSQPSRASEDSILACLARHFPATHPSLLLGRGDDCAVLKAGTPLCVSSDLFLEDVHFRRSYFTPEEIGHKALAVNVSDIAACGGRPPGSGNYPPCSAFCRIRRRFSRSLRSAGLRRSASSPIARAWR